MYNTARSVLEQAGWQYPETKSMTEAHQRTAALGIDLSKAALFTPPSPPVSAIIAMLRKRTRFLS
ncbi:MAG: M14 family metallocarboxypeptidase [Oscillospiraceae bacterium]|jgi:hypothetical protein|nr:M14 family metallocarboxypeptidase [Oscillospiraceae bacterium]